MPHDNRIEKLDRNGLCSEARGRSRLRIGLR